MSIINNIFTDYGTIIWSCCTMSSYRTVEVCCVIQLSSSDPADAASFTRGNSLFAKALPLCRVTLVLLSWDSIFFIVQRGLLLPSGFISHHTETSKGDEVFLWFFRVCLQEETSSISLVRGTLEDPLPSWVSFISLLGQKRLLVIAFFFLLLCCISVCKGE